MNHKRKGYYPAFVLVLLPLFLFSRPPASYPAAQGPRLLKIGAMEGDKFVQIELVASGEIGDLIFDGRADSSSLSIFIPNASFSAPKAWVRTGSEVLKRLKVQSTKGGVRITGQAEKPWTSSAVRKDGAHAYLRLYFDDNSDAPRVTIPAPAIPVASREQTFQQQPVAEMREEEIEKLLEQLGPVPGPGAVPGTEKQYLGAPISLDLVDADIKNVVRLIAEISGTNIVVDPQVQGRITMKVENVPWDQVLDMILEANDLGTKRQGNVIRITTKEKLQKEIELDQALAEAQLKLFEKRAELEAKKKDRGPIETAFIPIYYLVGVSAPGEVQTEKETTAITLAGTSVTTKETKKPLIVALLQPLLSEKGQMVYDSSRRMLIVRDYSSRIAEIRKVIAQLDRPPEQVKLELRIVEAITSFTKALGINWGFSYQNTGNHSFSPSFDINFPIDTVTSSLSFGWSLLKGQSIFNIDMAINASKELGKTKLLAAPVVYTMTNQEAKITQGTEIPVLEMTEYGELAVEYKDVILELTIVPSVTPDKRILMNIHARKQDIGQDRILAEAAGLKAVDILKKTLDTNVLVDDGTIVVIGGVLREDKRYTRRGTPGLERLPVFGWLFKSYEKDYQTEELLIFISPKIIELPAISTAAAYGESTR
ncbi:secretin and TonB N-terminal domain-containing protein [Thermodesulforhabdus norvegica]|uniref:Type IV pilus assembly protein PilQ n=1 Tax=Thermodesulforhabdus norvegica TaxID=39841 RepID=A0A1I4U083_9BACT|nr:secretin and TonB N-terminal domain-containing protein [Thermodesulforhabdus norvegica]SFM82444.1 type IV pilus assembly protein PilQ [Thermodesulforhabdus norvegica]